MSLADKILEYYPEARDCLGGHIGVPLESIEDEQDDDRYVKVIVTRCSHCGIPLDERYL